MKFETSYRLSELTDIEAVPLRGDPRVAEKPTPGEVEATLSTDILTLDLTSQSPACELAIHGMTS